ncbi:MAG: MerR family transcriptional regulator [Acidobacteria bacterium]|nr:MerR family transcriptional regulator [Acidobacteriota bacterium]
MKSEIYDIKTVCAEAGVTPRTVHYYIQQGLLPPAGSQGPGARYGEGHLARLKLIKLLQSEHLPLSDIRRRLESLDDAQVEQLVREHQNKRPSGSSAVEYIRNVLSGTRHGTPVQGRTPQRVEEPKVAHSVRGSSSQLSERAQWERITLAPDIELHIRRPLSRIQNRKVETLIQQAKEILREES